MPADQHPVIVIEEEHPPQVSTRRHSRVPAVHRGLIIGQNSTGMACKLRPTHQQPTQSHQTVTGFDPSASDHIRTLNGGNSGRVNPPTPLTVPLLLKPRHRLVGPRWGRPILCA